ncbi:HNH endonuclease [Piscibacillus sp. B03]|uniref:HNH endonuclease n=1 Tax=Piscibacillus sp. B03 TaxID=3457430 RepID=UPI003FCE00EF
MKNFYHLTDSPKTWFEDIANIKRGENKTILESIKDKVFQQYDNYWQSKSNLETLISTSFSDKEREALLHCYDNQTQKLEELKLKIRQTQPIEFSSTCQYCGINYPNTFDHYIPKEIFPELSVLHYNLIPCCSECNSNKGSKWISNNDERRFLQLYFDKLPTDRQYLFTEIKFDDGIPNAKFYIRNEYGVKEDLFNIIESHFKELNLRSRYALKSNEVISEIKGRTLTYIMKDIDAPIENIIESEIFALRNQYGMNYWKASLYEGLLYNEFIETLRLYAIQEMF